MMLVGLFRMRLKTGGVFGLGRILWKQVRWWPRAGCDTPKFTDVNFCSPGSHLAFDCHRC